MSEREKFKRRMKQERDALIARQKIIEMSGAMVLIIVIGTTMALMN
jgi:hypothetical protein